MWGHTEIPLHPRLETIKYNSIYYLISLRQDLTRIFVMRIHSLTYCLSFLLLFVTMWILNIYPTLALLGVTFSIVQSLWSKITRLLRLSAFCCCKTNITLTLGVEWLISRRTLFLLSFRIYIFLCRLMVAVLTIVHSSSRHPVTPAAGSFTLLDQLRDCACTGDSAWDHQCLCLPQFLEIVKFSPHFLQK